MLGTEPGKRGPGEERGDLAIADDAATEIGTEDQIAERRVVELDLVISRTTDTTRDGEAPRTYAPAPRCTMTSHENAEPKMCSPTAP